MGSKRTPPKPKKSPKRKLLEEKIQKRCEQVGADVREQFDKGELNNKVRFVRPYSKEQQLGKKKK